MGSKLDIEAPVPMTVEGESMSLQSESQTPTRGQTYASLKQAGEERRQGGKAGSRYKGGEKGKHKRRGAKGGKGNRAHKRQPVYGSGFRCRVQRAGRRVQGAGCRVRESAERGWFGLEWGRLRVQA